MLKFFSIILSYTCCSDTDSFSLFYLSFLAPRLDLAYSLFFCIYCVLLCELFLNYSFFSSACFLALKVNSATLGSFYSCKYCASDMLFWLFETENLDKLFRLTIGSSTMPASRLFRLSRLLATCDGRGRLNTLFRLFGCCGCYSSSLIAECCSLSPDLASCFSSGNWYEPRTSLLRLFLKPG